jgi:hypothetical protein
MPCHDAGIGISSANLTDFSISCAADDSGTVASGTIEQLLLVVEPPKK